MLILVTFPPLVSFKNFLLKLKPSRQCRHTQGLLIFPSAHLSTVNVVEDKVQFVSSLEREVKAHQERVFHILQQNIPFWHNMLFLGKGQLRFSGKFECGTQIPRWNYWMKISPTSTQAHLIPPSFSGWLSSVKLWLHKMLLLLCVLLEEPEISIKKINFCYSHPGRM